MSVVLVAASEIAPPRFERYHATAPWGWTCDPAPGEQRS